MNSYIYIKFKKSYLNMFMEKCHQLCINIYSIKEQNNYCITKLNLVDYQNFQKYCKNMKIKPLFLEGPEYVKITLKKYLSWFIFLVLAVLLVILLSGFIVDIKVDSVDSELSKKVIDQLEQYGIHKFSFRKSFNKITKIKEEIRKNLQDDLEWIEITKKGMIYDVKIERRISDDSLPKYQYCTVFAKKDGMIVGSRVYVGDFVVDYNDYVKKGDVLISGDIVFNDEIVDHVCAQGEIYAEVWYHININIPLNYYLKVKGNKRRKNIIINYNDIEYPVFKDRLKDYQSTSKMIFDALGVRVYLRTDTEIKRINKKYSEEEAINKAIELAKQKVELKLKNGDKIIKEKVLQKQINNSTMNVDIFIIAKEQIGESIALKED